jgi:hypothetical protein
MAIWTHGVATVGAKGELAPTAISIAKLPSAAANPHRRDPRAKTAEASGPRAARPELVLQTGVSWSASKVAFSPDGRLLASRDFMAGSIKLWEVSTRAFQFAVKLKFLMFPRGAYGSRPLRAGDHVGRNFFLGM